ncbi:flavin reductase family protein [Pseudenhygromyxa sp. WMMC2535]|uniref:flavin reductase family protein n=1 Tax=Pseudenhygromyxa sp. WMMC2535 TaxID=2712867 RepID=UPI0015954C4F|nr:flavin reductase family protein [Pseudenhygromyxa sp. WMMC2535]NVB41561.1 flavin reductase family protein [Pseudenhygromyxa sp. WMMC2535]
MARHAPMTDESRQEPAEELSASELRARDCYRLMTDLVAPRPIAWVSTLSADGRGNLAPFSYYQAVCSLPPTIVISVGWLGDGRPKDTLANILETRELTISHVSEPFAEAMNATSASLPRGESEWARYDIAASPAHSVAPPRVAGAIAGLECRLTQAIPLGQTARGTPSSTLLIAEVQHFWVAAGLLQRDERGSLLPMDPAALAALSRLGGVAYAPVREVLELERPS